MCFAWNSVNSILPEYFATFVYTVDLINWNWKYSYSGYSKIRNDWNLPIDLEWNWRLCKLRNLSFKLEWRVVERVETIPISRNYLDFKVVYFYV